MSQNWKYCRERNVLIKIRMGPNRSYWKGIGWDYEDQIQICVAEWCQEVEYLVEFKVRYGIRKWGNVQEKQADLSRIMGN